MTSINWFAREGIKHKINREEGLGWALMTRENTKDHLELTLVEKLHLLHHLSSDLMFCDLSFDMKGATAMAKWTSC
jgi:hypothetical protein